MRLRMPAPYRHPKSGIFWMRLRVPADLVAVVGKAEEKFSLRTRDPAQAKSAYLEHMKTLQARWQTLRLGPSTISHKEAIAIAGDFYRALVSQHEENPGERDVALGSLISEQVAAGSPGVRIFRAGNPVMTQRMLDRMMNRNRAPLRRYFEERGEIVDAESFERVLKAVNKAMLQGREQIMRFIEEDYRPDPNAARFPVRKSKATAQFEPGGDPSRHLLVDVYNRYADETKQTASTRKKWGAIVAGVAKSHPDIRTITPEWCVSWKDGLVRQGLSLRTIHFGYLAALRSTCEWGKANLLIPANPMEGIRVRVGKIPEGLKKRGYKTHEAKFVLGLTMQEQKGKLSKHQKLARRWIPWVCCYTGARVGEIAQLRKEDLHVKDGIALIWITPEAGGTKDKNERYVALHSHLIEQGFLDFVASSKSGPLFFDPGLSRGGSAKNPQSKKVGERICSWLRASGMTDTRLSPNHAWRHRFKTVCRANKVDPGARDYMQGHVPHNDAEGYGEFPAEALRHEIEKLPRLDITL